MLYRYSRLAPVLLVLFLLPACSNLVDTVQPSRAAERTFAAPDVPVIGQTFVASHDGLNTVYVALSGDLTAVANTLTLHLSAGPGQDTDLRTVTANSIDQEATGFARFSFAPLPHSHGQRLFFSVETSSLPGKAVALPYGSPDSYYDGAAYLNGTPQDFQTTFKLGYSWPYVVWGLLETLPDTLPVAALLLLPGLALFVWLIPAPTPVRFLEVLIVASGLSLALSPLLFLWLHPIAPISMGRARTGVFLLLSLAGLASGFWRHRRNMVWKRPPLLPEDWGLLGLAGLIMGMRFLIVRSISFPLWGDSVQHTAIALRIVESGGLFDSWLPYAPFDSFTVHFGFHSVVALFHWVTGIPVVRSVLLTGQLLNGLAVLTLFPLATYMFRNRWAGLVAVLTAGLLSPLPMFYVNWGRYPQLAGQVILPLAILLLLMALEQTANGKTKKMVIAAIAIAGMTLAYYRMPFYLAAFMLAWFLVCWLPEFWRDREAWIHLLIRVALVGMGTLILLAPQIMRLRQGNLVAGLQAGVTAQTTATTWSHLIEDYHIWYDLGRHVPLYLQLIALAAWLWSLRQRQRYGIVLGLWVLILALLPAGRLVHLPGANMMQGFAVIIALYIPVGLLVGYLAGELVRPLVHQNVRRTSIALLFLAGVAAWGTIQNVATLNPSYMMVTKSDEAAMNWVRQNTPSRAKFLVNGFRIYGGRSAVGSDSGWWIPLLTQRANTMPPQYALLNEKEHAKGIRRDTTDLVAQLEHTSLSTPEGVHLLCNRDITHVYIGQGQGKIGNPFPLLFTRKELEESPYFRLVYRQDRVAIFALTAGACTG